MIDSRNEWDTLEQIIIGDASGANWPSDDPVFSQEHTRTAWTETPVPTGPVPQHIIDEANEDLEALADVCRQFGAQVLRPAPMDFVATKGLYNYCPRDRLLVYKNNIVDCAMFYPCRDQEINNYDQVLTQAQVMRMPRDQGMAFDAANVCRCGDFWLYLQSHSGNQAAYEWLCQQFPEVNIIPVSFYRGVHIDSTVVPLKPGLVVLNGGRVNQDNTPAVFDTWTKIYVEDVVPQAFYQYPYASKWIALNMLSLDPDTVIVDKQQTALIRTLEAHKMTVVPLELRHSRTLGGGFHCVTLDTRRRHA
jgi:N-dimethylarginine dimethylaminohydrolase